MLKNLHKRVLIASLFTILAFGAVTPSYSQETCSRYAIATGYRVLPPECTQNGFTTTTASGERTAPDEDFLSRVTKYLKSFFG